MTSASWLVDRIRLTGPVPFEQFQAAALYDPHHGFFAAGPLRSTRGGDFLTSPEVSPLFGETVAALIDTEHRRVGKPDPFLLVDAGAGSGSLLRPLLAAVAAPVEPWAIEASPAARAHLEQLVPGRVGSGLSDLPDRFAGVIVANELIDNLPVAVAVRTGRGWKERWVAAGDDRLELVAHPARPEVVEWADRYAGPVAEGGVVEVQLQAGAWVEEALSRLAAGALVVIDYGDTAEGLVPRRREGTLRTYRAHHLGPHPLDEPGSTDITCDVNFTGLVGAATGANQVEVQRQEEWLGGLGLRRRLSELREQELELAREGDALERLRVRSVRTEAETLLHPRGLGDFRVMVARVGNDPQP